MKTPQVPFDDSIADLTGGTPTPRPTQERLPDTRSREQKLADHFDGTAERENVFNEKCDKCAGRGYWKSPRFKCFKCQGRGVLSFKTSPETRAKGRARSAEKAAQREIDKAAWREANADAIAWTRRAATRNAERNGTFDFPAKLIEALNEYGSWTDAQLAAVQKLMARDEVRKAEWQARYSTVIDATKIENAFVRAKEHAARPGMRGIWTRPLKLRGDKLDLTFTPGSAGSQWEGMIFVRSGDKKLGVIKAGLFERRSYVTDAEAAAVTKVCADPAQAAVAYGKAWGVCTVCGRTLTNDGSIEAGIGPICRESFGW